jgi:predicted nucleic acid-binding protein
MFDTNVLLSGVGWKGKPYQCLEFQLKAIPADPDDDKVLECACQASATHIVTGDRRHLLPLGSFQGIPIVTAAVFLAAITTP